MTVKIEAAGSMILVQPVKVKALSAGGIILTGGTEKEDNAIGLGRVVDIGPTAYIGVQGCNKDDLPPSDYRYDYDHIRRWNSKLAIGVVVSYNRHVGNKPDVPEYKDYKLIPDIAVNAVVEGDFEVLKTDF